MADKSVHFTTFLANLVPKVLNDACAILPSGPAGHIASKSLLYLCPYIVRMYIFWPSSDFAPAHKWRWLSDWHHSTAVEFLYYKSYNPILYLAFVHQVAPIFCLPLLTCLMDILWISAHQNPTVWCSWQPRTNNKSDPERTWLQVHTKKGGAHGQWNNLF